MIRHSKQVPVGTPIALMSEEEASMDELDKLPTPPDNYSAYQEGGSSMRTLIWQSYLKSSEQPPEGCL